MCRRTTRSCLSDLVFSKNHVPPWIPLIVGFGPPHLPFLCCYCRHHEKFFFPVSISFFSFRTAGLDWRAVSRSKRLWVVLRVFILWLIFSFLQQQTITLKMAEQRWSDIYVVFTMSLCALGLKQLLISFKSYGFDIRCACSQKLFEANLSIWTS